MAHTSLLGSWIKLSGSSARRAVKPTLTWLAAVGGTSILVVPTQFEIGFTQPIVCRTAGSSEADGCGGTCGRFSSAMWCASAVHEHLLAGLEAQGGRAHLFDVRRCTDRAPRLANPVMVIAPGGPV